MSFGSTIALLSITVGIGKLIDSFLNESNLDEVKEKLISAWVELSDEEFSLSRSISVSLDNFNRFFTSIYGYKHFTFKCFYRSAISSIFFLLLLCLLRVPIEYLMSGRWGFIDFGLLLSHRNFYLLLITNIVADYISLTESRYILKKMKGKKMSAILFGYLPFDFFISFLVGSLPIFLAGVFSFFPSFFYSTNYPSVQAMVDLTSMMMLSTFFTSLLFYLFVTFTLFLLTLSFFRRPIRAILERLATLKNPITSLAGAFAAIILIIKGISILTGPY